METPTRRALLASGVGLATGVAGCASIAGRFEDAQPAGEPTTGPGRVTRTRDPETDTPQGGDGGGANECTLDAGGGATGNETGTNGTATGDRLGRVSIEPSDVSFDRAPKPETPGDYGYARMGRDDAPVTATIYGNWKCPYTREFALTILPDLVEEFVEPGDVAFEFRAVAYAGGDPYLGPDAPRAARGGLAVWHTDPGSYWQYFALVFTNQPQERYAWATTDRLVRFADAADVGATGEVRAAIEGGAYENPVRKSSRAARRRAVTAVPRVATESTLTAPTVDAAATRRQLRASVERSGNQSV